MPDASKRRIYVECTHTFWAGGNSGIRRVARNLANKGRALSEGDVDIIPVVWCGGGFLTPRRDLTASPHPIKRCIICVHFLIGKAYQCTPSLLRKPFTWLRRLLVGNMQHNLDSELVFRLLGIVSFPLMSLSGRTVKFEPGDIVVLVDSTWNSERMLEYLFKAKVEAEIRLGAMIHDLFPLVLPETCQQETVTGFTSWFCRIAPEVDFFVTNSVTTSNALEKYLHENRSLRPYACPVKAFPLGAELDLSSQGRGESDNVMCIWETPGAMALAVGTVEPRKNYDFLIDAMDCLWAKKEDVSLFIIGSPGWKSQDLLDRIRAHQEYGVRLFLLTDASDNDLEQAFQRADCMVCCSVAEGFGLPVAEGMMHGLPVFASDIPVFREIGGAGCNYFSLDSPDILATQLKKWLEMYRQGIAGLKVRDFKWPDWKESSRRFAQVVLELGEEQELIGPGR